jgi:hypothetical protein
VLAKASESFPVLSVEEEVWSGDRMDFRVRALGQVAACNVRVFDDSVRPQCAGRRVGWWVARGNATIQHMRRGGRQQRWKARNLDLPLPPKGAYKPKSLAPPWTPAIRGTADGILSPLRTRRELATPVRLSGHKDTDGLATLKWLVYKTKVALQGANGER